RPRHPPVRLPDVLLRCDEHPMAERAVRAVPRGTEAAARGTEGPIHVRGMAAGIRCAGARGQSRFRRGESFGARAAGPVTYVTPALTQPRRGWYIWRRRGAV